MGADTGGERLSRAAKNSARQRNLEFPHWHEASRASSDRVCSPTRCNLSPGQHVARPHSASNPALPFSHRWNHDRAVDRRGAPDVGIHDMVLLRSLVSDAIDLNSGRSDADKRVIIPPNYTEHFFKMYLPSSEPIYPLGAYSRCTFLGPKLSDFVFTLNNSRHRLPFPTARCRGGARRGAAA